MLPLAGQKIYSIRYFGLGLGLGLELPNMDTPLG